MNTKRLSSVALVIMLLLSMAMIAIPPTMAVPTTYVSVINPATGDGDFNYTNLSPPPGNVFTVNITVTDVQKLAGWQVNLTWDPTLLKIFVAGDVFLPADHIFWNMDPLGAPPDISNTAGYVMFARAIGTGSPYTSFNGSGRLMCVKFTVIKTPTELDPLLSCTLGIDKVGILPTKLVDEDAALIPFTEQNGYYEYKYLIPPPTKPWLEVPPETVVGWPLVPPIVGTPNAFFTVDVSIKNVTSKVDLIGEQNIAVMYPNDVIRLNNPADPTQNVSEGTFMNNPSWAPYGTTFIWIEDINYPMLGINTISMGIIINPNTTTSEYDWPERPFGDGVLATFHFEVIYQEEYPWYNRTDLNIEPLFPGEMFLNSTEDWIEYQDPLDGYISIYGYTMGRMIDVYIGICLEDGYPCEPFPDPYGGQGPNGNASLIWAQKKVCMWARVTYNNWPVQRKVVTYEILYPNGETLTVLSNVTDDDGIAFASFRMPWPCDDPESLFGIWEIIASVDIACVIKKDYLHFHYHYKAWTYKVTVAPTQIGHCGYVNITVKIRSYDLLPNILLVTVDLKDELQVPIGFQTLWLNLTTRPIKEWCTYKEYTLKFTIHIPKHAFAGIAKAHVNILSELPSRCGAAYCPEYIEAFTILAKWE